MENVGMGRGKDECLVMSVAKVGFLSHFSAGAAWVSIGQMYSRATVGPKCWRISSGLVFVSSTVS